MVRHVGAHDGDLGSLGKPRLRVVQGLVPAIAAPAANLGQTHEVARRGLRIDHRCKRRRIRGDDGVVAEPALEAQTGNAKARILIGEFQIARVVGGFRGAPRHAALAPYFICWRTTRRFVCSSRLPAGARMTSDGIRYSNIDPDHEISAEP